LTIPDGSARHRRGCSPLRELGLLEKRASRPDEACRDRESVELVGRDAAVRCPATPGRTVIDQ
jgi:hypothetical protein